MRMLAGGRAAAAGCQGPQAAGAPSPLCARTWMPAGPHSMKLAAFFSRMRCRLLCTCGARRGKAGGQRGVGAGVGRGGWEGSRSAAAPAGLGRRCCLHRRARARCGDARSAAAGGAAPSAVPGLGGPSPGPRQRPTCVGSTSPAGGGRGGQSARRAWGRHRAARPGGGPSLQPSLQQRAQRCAAARCRGSTQPTPARARPGQNISWAACRAR
jgi:hypothetical protein